MPLSVSFVPHGVSGDGGDHLSHVTPDHRPLSLTDAFEWQFLPQPLTAGGAETAMYGGGETLEEAFLTSNVPGRYSKWDKGEQDDSRHEDCADASDCRNCDEEAADEHDGYRPDSEELDPVLKAIDDKRRAGEERVPEGVREAIKRGERPGARTGTKGVLADYKAFEVAKYQQVHREKQTRQDILKRIAEGAVQAPIEPKDHCPQLHPSTVQRLLMGTEEEDDGEEDDDDFLRKYRAQRLRDMKAAASMPVFGEIREFTPFEFVDALKDQDPRVKVVVHLYESHIRACQVLNRHLEVLARRYSSMLFVRLRASSMKEGGIDEAALPMLVVYKDGDVVEMFPRVQDEFGDGFSGDDIEWLLASKDLLDSIGSDIDTRQSNVLGVRCSTGPLDSDM